MSQYALKRHPDGGYYWKCLTCHEAVTEPFIQKDQATQMWNRINHQCRGSQ